MKSNLKKDFTDEKGTGYTLIAEGEKKEIHLGKKYKLQHEFKEVKKKSDGVFTSDIGIHSNGFAGIMGLAMILALAGIIIAYLFWRF